jgi:hypothetical protein
VLWRPPLGIAEAVDGPHILVAPSGHTLVRLLLGDTAVERLVVIGDGEHHVRALDRTLARRQDALFEERRQPELSVFWQRDHALIRCDMSSNDRTLGWAGLAAQLEIHEVVGLHAAVVAEPRVKYFVDRFRPCLERAQAQHSAPRQRLSPSP